MLPLVSHRAKVFQPVSIARAIWIYGEQIGSNRVSAVRSSFPAFLIFDPLKPPKMPFSDLEGIIFFSLCLFSDESACVRQILSRSDHRQRREYAWKETHIDTRTHTHTYV